VVGEGKVKGRRGEGVTWFTQKLGLGTRKALIRLWWRHSLLFYAYHTLRKLL